MLDVAVSGRVDDFSQDLALTLFAGCRRRILRQKEVLQPVDYDPELLDREPAAEESWSAFFETHDCDGHRKAEVGAVGQAYAPR